MRLKTILAALFAAMLAVTWTGAALAQDDMAKDADKSAMKDKGKGKAKFKKFEKKLETLEKIVAKLREAGKNEQADKIQKKIDEARTKIDEKKKSMKGKGKGKGKGNGKKKKK